MGKLVDRQGDERVGGQTGEMTNICYGWAVRWMGGLETKELMDRLAGG